MTTTTTPRKSGFHIEVSCPGCGADLTMDDDYFVVRCHHCDSLQRLVMPDLPAAYLAPVKITPHNARVAIDRYLKERNEPLTGSDFALKQVYYPYWKIDAVLFKVRKSTEKRTVVDSSEYAQEVSYEKEQTEISLSPYSTTLGAGVMFQGIPETIGLRGDYIKATTFSEEHINDDFDALPVLTPWEEVRINLHSRMRAISSFDSNTFGANKTELFCPRASLLYMPFLVFDFYSANGFNRYVIDGVSGRICGHLQELDDSPAPVVEYTEDIKFGGVTVVPHRCGNCGVDLPEQASLIYICGNCQAIEKSDTNLLSITSLQIVTGVKDCREARYVPFWAFQLKPVDAQRLQPIIGGIYHSPTLVLPAFKIANYDALFKLTKKMSAAWPKLSFAELFATDKRYAPVTLKPDEAFMYADLIIHKDSYVKGLNADEKRLPFSPENVSLFYLPFERENYFYLDSVLGAISLENRLIP